ncbi:MAG: cyclic nucleotide-binding domain-containing protein [Chromatiales bacterium]|nr:cyclic nucleotide-binding domain-containing protein [Chromatiales bacterium]
MSGQIATIDKLRQFSPLDGLKRDNLDALAKKVQVRHLEPGRLLFRAGDTDKRTYYLVAGTLELEAGDGQSGRRLLRADSEEARHPVSPLLPRTCTARAVDGIEFISIDTELLDVMLTWDQTGSYEVGDLREDAAESGTDWMTALLQTKAFHRIPPANLQAIFMRMQQVHYSAGDVVIKQGEPGDFFYVIVRGRCAVTRETPLNRDGIKLAELGVGDTFGEEALIADARRNATISMLTDGALMRLGKEDFNTLLNEPMLSWVDYEQGCKLAASGARWLDVRLPSEFEAGHEPGAINIPLYFIRLKLNALDPSVPYLVCCDTGRRSSAGAYILNERGYDARVLRGGLNASKPA